MQHHRSPRVWLLWIPLAVACSQGGDAPAAEVDLGASTSSSTNPDAPPTSAAPTTSATGSTTSTSTGPGDMTTTTGDAASSGSSGEPADSTGDTPSPSCGDAQLDPGEECDPGWAQLSNLGSCTLECQLAKCGDGLLHVGKEACDNGASNNNTAYGGCTQKCELGPRCNDGKVQGPEECDLGDDNGSGEFLPDGVPCDGGCRYQARQVFLSSIVYRGGELGGVEGAHTQCRLLAEKAGLDNSASFMAWLSDALHSPAKDFTHADDIPYVRPDGVRVADDWDDLVQNGPHDGITVTEKGELLLDVGVWTGTGQGGSLINPDAHCKAWTNLDPNQESRIGRSGIDKVLLPKVWDQWYDNRHWTNFTNLPCENKAYLYCFEQ
jgi:hypothetical protein